jgi:signal peptidase I
VTSWLAALSTAGAATAVIGLAAWRQRRAYLVVTVRGSSMSPTYLEGDRVLVRRVGVAAVRPGEVALLTMPAGPVVEPDELMIKRIAAVPGDPVPDGIPVAERLVPAGRLVVLGDNSQASYDSRRAGYFDASTLIGVVVRAMRQQARGAGVG